MALAHYGKHLAVTSMRVLRNVTKNNKEDTTFEIQSCLRSMSNIEALGQDPREKDAKCMGVQKTHAAPGGVPGALQQVPLHAHAEFAPLAVVRAPPCPPLQHGGD